MAVRLSAKHCSSSTICLPQYPAKSNTHATEKGAKTSKKIWILHKTSSFLAWSARDIIHTMYVALQQPPTSSLYVFDGRCAMFAWLTGHPLYYGPWLYLTLNCYVDFIVLVCILHIYIYRNRLMKFMLHGYVPFYCAFMAGGSLLLAE